jgi:uncharacterized membrane protein YbjE (DUF340 family)
VENLSLVRDIVLIVAALLITAFVAMAAITIMRIATQIQNALQRAEKLIQRGEQVTDVITTAASVISALATGFWPGALAKSAGFVRRRLLRRSSVP